MFDKVLNTPLHEHNMVLYFLKAEKKSKYSVLLFIQSRAFYFAKWPPEGKSLRWWRRSNVFIVNFIEDISHLALVFLLLPLNW